MLAQPIAHSLARPLAYALYGPSRSSRHVEPSLSLDFVTGTYRVTPSQAEEYAMALDPKPSLMLLFNRDWYLQGGVQ